MIVAIRSTLLAAVGSVFLAAGCEPAACVPFDLKQGKTYRLALLEAYDANVTMALFDQRIDDDGARATPCGVCPGIGPQAGTVLEFTAGPRDQEYVSGLSCRFWRMLPAPWDGVEFGSFGVNPPGTHETFAGFISEIHFEACQRVLAGIGLLSFVLQVPDRGDPFRSPVPGERPPLLARRTFQSESLSCGDNWIAKLDPVAP